LAAVSRSIGYFVWFIAVCHLQLHSPLCEHFLTVNHDRFGYDSAFIGTTIARDSFKRDFGITGEVANSISSNITSAFQAGAFFGAIFCFLITERVGRKWALEVSSVIFVVGAVLMTAATSQLSYICEFGTPSTLSVTQVTSAQSSIDLPWTTSCTLPSRFLPAPKHQPKSRSLTRSRCWSRSHGDWVRYYNGHSPELHRRVVRPVYSWYPHRSVRNCLPSRFRPRFLDQLWNHKEYGLL
jgi:hypothetical protein